MWKKQYVRKQQYVWLCRNSEATGTVQSCKSCTLGEHSEFVLLEGLQKKIFVVHKFKIDPTQYANNPNPKTTVLA